MTKRSSTVRRPSAPDPTPSGALPQSQLSVAPWRGIALRGLLLIAATCLVYANSFQGAFVFDDIGHIVEGLLIRPLWPLTDLLRAGGVRWLLVFTLSLNHALGGLETWGYHLVNLLIHLVAGLLLWNLLRNVLARPRVAGAWSSHAETLAFAIALLWLVHPLQTQSVTYIVQRCEAMMGMFFLAVLCCLEKSDRSRYSTAWLCGAIGAFWLGLGSKEVIAVAPFVGLLFDRVFLAESWKEVIRRRGWAYGVMLLPGVLAVPLIWRSMTASEATVGFQMDSLLWYEYLRSQPGVILRYLQLVLVPYPQCIDYGWPVADDWLAIIVPSSIVVGLIGLSLYALYRWPAWGFLGASFFLVLAPTSSVVLIWDLAVEHRMYLPLAPILTMLVLAGYWLVEQIATAQRWSPNRQLRCFYGAALCPALLFGMLTVLRNHDYRTNYALWEQTAAVQPGNIRAVRNLCVAPMEDGRAGEDLEVLRGSIQRCEALGLPTRHHRVELGEALAISGRWEEAMKVLAQAVDSNERSLRMNPGERRKLGDAYLSLALAAAKAGSDHDAERYFENAIELRPDFSTARALYGEFLNTHQRHDAALVQWREGLRLQPDFMDLHRSLVLLLLHLKKKDEATAHLKLQPNSPAFADLHEVIRVAP